MSDVLERIGWILIHSLWELTLLGLIAWLGYLALQRFSALTRYCFLCGCLLACGLAPVLTWFWLDSLAPFSPHAASLETVANHGSQVTTSHFSFKKIPGPPLNYIRLNWLFQQSLRVLSVTWVAVVSFLFFRIFGDYRGLSRLLASARAFPRRQIAERKYVVRLNSLARRLGIQRTVFLMESALVDVPSIVGWFKPILLVPVAFLGSMPPDQIEAILAHELAHVKRADYIVNLLQMVIETMLFFHPSVRWISYVIREERENCCDDIAISIFGDRMTYVSALAALAERNLPLASAVMAADGGSLVKRVRRVLGAEQTIEIRGMGIVRQVFMGMLLGILTTGVCSAVFVTADNGQVITHVDSLNLTKALVAASETGDTASMERLIQQGADLDKNVYPSGQNSLFTATAHHQFEAVDLLLQRGASVDGRSTSGQRPIDWALASGDLTTATLLHDHGAKLSPGAWAAATDDMAQLSSLAQSSTFSQEQEDEMMKYAVSMGHLDIVQFLEKVTKKPVTGRFLSDAASGGNVAMLNYILKQKVDMHTVGANALNQAVLFYDRPQAAKILLQHGVDPNQLPSNWGRYYLSEAKNAQMVGVLLDGGANPNSEDRTGTPLCNAPDAESVRLLVRHGANLHPVLRSGLSLIESAVGHDQYDRLDVLLELIKQGAYFDPKKNGTSALAEATSRNKLKTVKCLLDLGVNPNSYLMTPFWQTSIIHSAVIGSSTNAAQLLLQQGVTPSGDTRDDLTPSSLALMIGNDDMANLLRQAGARDIGDLSLAAASGDTREVQRLIAEGADVNQKDPNGHTPLFYAIRFHQDEISRLLIEHGAIHSQTAVSPDSR